MPNTSQFLRSLVLTAACVFSVGACNGPDSPASVFKAPPADMLWSLHATVPATTIAVGGTQQLGATASLSDGTTASSTPTVTYVSTDPTRVQVTSSGLVTGLGVTATAVPVIESVVTPGLTLVDTTFVGVTATAHPLKLFTLHPQPGDSNRVTMQNSRLIPLTATDLSDAPVAGLAVKYTSLNPSIFYISGNYVVGSMVGTAKLIASTLAYGVQWTDTVDFAVSNPLLGYLYCYTNTAGGCTFYTSLTVIGVGGEIDFTNFSAGPMTLTFNDPSTITGGNIVDAAKSSTSVRVFTAAGTYKAQDPYGNSTTILVLPAN